MTASKTVSTSESPALLRQLGIVSATALVVSNIIGVGIFTSTGFLAADLGDPKLVLLIWIAGALCAMAGAFCYSELGVNFPSSGGEYVYLTRAFGPTWGFMTGWLSFVAGFAAPIASNALACAAYLSFFFPAWRETSVIGTDPFVIRLGWGQAFCVVLVVLFSFLNIVGLRWSARVQNFLTGTKLAVIFGFIVLGLTVGKGDWANFSEVIPRSNPGISVSEQFALSLFWIYVSYSGWNAATYVAEELKNPARTLPIALALGTTIAAALFLILNVVFIYASPMSVMKGVFAIGSLTAERLFGQEAAGVFSALMALALLASVNSMVTIGPRVYYAMARNGAFFSGAAKVHPKYHTPVNSIIWQGLMTLVMLLTSFRDLMDYIGFTLNISAVMAVSSLFFLRNRPGWQKLKVVDFLFPLVPALFVLVGLWITYQGLTKKPVVSFAGLATVAIGALIYRFRIQKTGIVADLQ
ncbi:amino acid permease [Bryobacterales bacterium F-183]|nr:amino acid permease [Bryobacterales bacterium F-183]